MSLSWIFNASTKVTVSPSTLPSFNSASRFSPSRSTLALPVTFVPSCLSVNVYFCRPRCVLNSAFHVPETSAANMEREVTASARSVIWVFMFAFSKTSFVSILEQQRGELVQAAAPTLPLVRGVRRFVEDAVDARFFERRDVHLGIASETSTPNPVGAEFATSVAHEHELHLLLELRHVSDVRH